MRNIVILLLLLPIMGFHCGGDDEPAAKVTGLTIDVNSLNSSDIEAGKLSKDENISNGTSNPWGDLIKRAREVCGDDPTVFRVTRVSVTLMDAKDVDQFEDLVSGEAQVYFASTRGSDDDATRVVVGSSSALSGIGPVKLSTPATEEELRRLGDRLAGGDFHVGFSARTQRNADESFSVDVRISLDAEADCS